MFKRMLPLMALLAVAGVSTAAAQSDPMVGGHSMSRKMNIVQNALNSSDHTTLVAAVKAAGLVPTLESKGPFTVFAPTNEAFNALPAGTVDDLLKPENKATLTRILTYHVVPGMYDGKALMSLIKQGNGTAKLKTVEGDDLTFMTIGGKIMVKDDKGNVADVTIANVYQSNGVIHVINKVLMP